MKAGDRMYVSVQELCDCAVRCIDGPMGQVHDVVLSRSAWCARYAVVDLGIEMGRARVLLPLTDAEQVDPSRRRLCTAQPCGEIEWAPHYDPARPLTGRQEKTLAERHGWPAEWADAPEVHSPLAGLPRDFGKPVHANEEELENILSDSPETQSALRMIAAFTASSRDDQPVSIETLMVDPVNWRIPCLAVQCLPTAKPVVLQTRSISAIDWLHKHIYLADDAAAIARAPRFQPQIAARAALMQRIGSYYEEFSRPAAIPASGGRSAAVSCVPKT